MRDDRFEIELVDNRQKHHLHQVAAKHARAIHEMIDNEPAEKSFGGVASGFSGAFWDGGELVMQSLMGEAA